MPHQRSVSISRFRKLSLFASSSIALRAEVRVAEERQPPQARQLRRFEERGSTVPSGSADWCDRTSSTRSTGQVRTLRETGRRLVEGSRPRPTRPGRRSRSPRPSTSAPASRTVTPGNPRQNPDHFTPRITGYSACHTSPCAESSCCSRSSCANSFPAQTVRVFALQPDELAALGLTVVREPVGVHQPRVVVVRFGRDRAEQRELIDRRLAPVSRPSAARSGTAARPARPRRADTDRRPRTRRRTIYRARRVLDRNARALARVDSDRSAPRVEHETVAEARGRGECAAVALAGRAALAVHRERDLLPRQHAERGVERLLGVGWCAQTEHRRGAAEPDAVKAVGRQHDEHLPLVRRRNGSHPAGDRVQFYRVPHCAPVQARCTQLTWRNRGA